MDEAKIIETDERKNVEGNQQLNETAQDVPEKKYTQKEYEDGIKKANGKVMRKNAKLAEELEKSKTSENVAKLVAESIGYEGSIDGLFEVVAKHYGKDATEALEKYQNGDMSKREAQVRLETFEFLNNEETSEEDIVEEFESIFKKAKSEQTAADRVKMDILAKPYYKIVAKGHIRNAEKWYKENVGDDFDTFIGSEEVSDFVKGLEIPIDVAVKKYCKIKGIVKDSKAQPQKEKLSAGSAKGYGGGEPEFLSREQVAKMSREEIRENYDLIKKSEKKWYKKD